MINNYEPKSSTSTSTRQRVTGVKSNEEGRKEGSRLSDWEVNK
jgi:hypothetical protein